MEDAVAEVASPEGSGKRRKRSLVDEEDAVEDAVAEVASPEGSRKGGKCSLVDLPE